MTSLKTGFVENESPLEWVLNAFLFNEQETTSQIESQQTKLPDTIVALAPEGRVKNEYYHAFKARNILCRCVCIRVGKYVPAVACAFLVVDLI